MNCYTQVEDLKFATIGDSPGRIVLEHMNQSVDGICDLKQWHNDKLYTEHNAEMQWKAQGPYAIHKSRPISPLHKGTIISYAACVYESQ